MFCVDNKSTQAVSPAVMLAGLAQVCVGKPQLCCFCRFDSHRRLVVILAAVQYPLFGEEGFKECGHS